jgi:serine/threonine protein kinase
MDTAEQGIYLGVTLDGRYLLNAHLGSGSFSGVFRATDQKTRREVAVKILTLRSSHSTDARVEFDGEKALLQMLVGRSHVVSLLDHGTHQLQLVAPPGENMVTIDVPYLVLELADASLAELLLNRTRLPWQARLELYRDVVKGVHQMHLEDIVHRDIKSENSLVYSAPQQAKIADLGRSKHTRHPSRFIAEAYVAGRGDMRFAPPELLWLCGTEDPADMARVDLFLLGSLLFELATGVGITAVAFTDPRSTHAAAGKLPAAARKADLDSRRHELRQQFMIAYDLFAAEIPPHLREAAVVLLRQLTDPDPARRVPGYRRRTLTPWDLQWLLKKVDVLLKVEAQQNGRRRITRSARRKRPTRRSRASI